MDRYLIGEEVKLLNEQEKIINTALTSLLAVFREYQKDLSRLSVWDVL